MANKNPAQGEPVNKHFWKFINSAKDGKPPELILEGDISSTTWWGDEVTPRLFTEELNALGNVPEIIVRINSGGDVFAANSIYTRSKDTPATIVAMAGDVIEIPGNGVFMVHDPKMGAMGYFSAVEFTKAAEELKVIKQAIVNDYALKTKKEPEEIAAIMAAETWYDGKQAVGADFCDRLMFEDAQTIVENIGKVVVNSVSMDLEHFPNLSVSLLNRLTVSASVGFSNITHTQNHRKGAKDSGA